MSVILAIVFILAFGMPLAEFVSGDVPKGGKPLSSLGLSFMMGLGIVAVVMFFLGLSPAGFPPRYCFLTAGVLFCAITVFLCKPYMRNLPAIKLNKIYWIFAVIIAVEVVWVLILTIPFPVYSHDAVANYALKAKMFYLFDGIPSEYFGFPEHVVAHPDYPMMLPLIISFIYKIIGLNDVSVNFIMPVIYFAFLSMFFRVSLEFFTSSFALLITFILATIPQVQDYATILHADLIFTAFLTGSFIYLVHFMRRAKNNSLFISSILLGFCLWTKNEAIVLSAVYFAVLCLFLLNNKNMPWKERVIKFVSAFGPVVLIAAPWVFIKLKYGLSNNDINFSMLTSARLTENVKGIPIILNMFQQEVFGPKKWNIFWVLFFLVLFVKRRILWKEDVKYMTLFIVLLLGGYFMGYMLSTGETFYFLVNTTISRFMLHFAGICLFYAAFLVYEDMKNLSCFRKAG